MRAAWLEVNQIQHGNQIEQAIERVAFAHSREPSRREIQRAVDNTRRTDFNRWFRRQWYGAAARSSGRVTGSFSGSRTPKWGR